MLAPLTPYTTRAVHSIYLGDNLEILRRHVPDGAAALIYIDPPFNTGRAQARTRLKTVRSVREAYRALAPEGTLYFHIDYREVHYCKVLLDGIFGRDSFLNEIIWAYDYGGRPTRRWPPKHDNILVYVKDPSRYVFDTEAVERIPYMAPGLVGPEKAARGKLPTDTWWHTIVPTQGRERTGYPTQKPLGVLRRIVQASSRPGDLVLDFFAGSGTTGEACLETKRRFLLVDVNPEALEVMARRFDGVRGIRWVGYEPRAAAGQRGATGPVA